MTVQIDDRVRVYYNLHKELISVQRRNVIDRGRRRHGGPIVTAYGPWRVVDHVAAIELRDCRFIVSKAGVDRIRRLKRKQVVAKIEGYVMRLPDTPADKNHPLPGIDVSGWKIKEELHFNPYLCYHFYWNYRRFDPTSPMHHVHTSHHVAVIGKTIWDDRDYDKLARMVSDD